MPGSASRAPSWPGLCVRSGPALRGYGGGAVCLPPPIGGVVGSGLVGGRQGAEGERLLCLSPSLCLPGTGTKAGFAGVAQSMEGVVSILLPFVSVRSRLGAV